MPRTPRPSAPGISPRVVYSRALTEDELDATLRWQTRDGTYRLIQSLLRNSDADTALSVQEFRQHAATIDRLQSAIEAGRTTAALTLYRGIRDLDRIFDSGMPGSEPVRLAGFVATTTDPGVTLEFIPRRGGVLILHAPAGLRALDVATAGQPHLSHQQEILLADGSQIQMVRQEISHPLSNDVRFADRVVVEARILND